MKTIAAKDRDHAYRLVTEMCGSVNHSKYIGTCGVYYRIDHPTKGTIAQIVNPEFFPDAEREAAKLQDPSTGLVPPTFSNPANTGLWDVLKDRIRALTTEVDEACLDNAYATEGRAIGDILTRVENSLNGTGCQTCARDMVNDHCPHCDAQGTESDREGDIDPADVNADAKLHWQEQHREMEQWARNNPGAVMRAEREEFERQGRETFQPDVYVDISSTGNGPHPDAKTWIWHPAIDDCQPNDRFRLDEYTYKAGDVTEDFLYMIAVTEDGWYSVEQTPPTEGNSSGAPIWCKFYELPYRPNQLRHL
jgi:hypothetical protein